jgi:membrane associated rhomboid family serine protease
VNGDQWRRLGGYGAQMGLPPAVFLLLMANLAVYVLQLLTRGLAGVDPLVAWFSFVPSLAINKLQVWRFVSYMFLHGPLFHLLFNMLGLWLFGSRLEQYWGTRTFTRYYFICGIGGALLYGVFSLTGIAAYIPMVGASGAIYGILLAFGIAFPAAIIFVFFIPMPARVAVIIFFLLSVTQGFGGGGRGGNVAHLAHLGGMVAGFIFLWIYTGGRPSQVPRLPRRGGARGGYRTVGGTSDPHRRSAGQGGWLTQLYRAYVRWRTRLRLKVVDSQPSDTRRDGRGNGGPRRGDGGSDLQRVDEILEKISREGLKSLTPEEQEILRRASKKD